MPSTNEHTVSPPLPPLGGSAAVEDQLAELVAGLWSVPLTARLAAKLQECGVTAAQLQIQLVADDRHDAEWRVTRRLVWALERLETNVEYRQEVRRICRAAQLEPEPVVAPLRKAGVVFDATISPTRQP